MKKATQAIPNHLLRQERELRGWSQKYVAEQIDAADYYISRWECGSASPSPHYRRKLCALFGKNAKELGLLQDEQGETVDEQSAASLVLQHKKTPSSSRRTPIYDAAIPLPLPENSKLIGRDEVLQKLKSQLCANQNMPMTILCGLPGVGKTALAVALAHDTEIRARFPDGILWCGLGPRPDILEILSRWGTLLGISAGEKGKLQSSEAWTMALRSAIGTRRMLLVIDDAWKIEDALACKVGGPNCAYLLNTRLPKVASRFTNGHVTVVHELNEVDGLRLLTRLAPTVAQAEPEEIATLVQAVGGLPLALTLIGNFLRVQAHSGQQRRIRKALTQLHSPKERLQIKQPLAYLEYHPGLTAETALSLQMVIGLSDELLNEEAKQALRALSVFPARPNTFSEEAALAVAATQPEILDALADAGLLESSEANRYTLHQTIADYAALQRTDIEPEKRMAMYFASFVEAHQGDYVSLEQESANVLAALRIAYERDMSAILVRLGTVKKHSQLY